MTFSSIERTHYSAEQWSDGNHTDITVTGTGICFNEFHSKHSDSKIRYVQKNGLHTNAVRVFFL